VPPAAASHQAGCHAGGRPGPVTGWRSAPHFRNATGGKETCQEQNFSDKKDEAAGFWERGKHCSDPQYRMSRGRKSFRVISWQNATGEGAPPTSDPPEGLPSPPRDTEPSPQVLPGASSFPAQRLPLRVPQAQPIPLRPTLDLACSPQSPPQTCSVPSEPPQGRPICPRAPPGLAYSPQGPPRPVLFTPGLAYSPLHPSLIPSEPPRPGLFAPGPAYSSLGPA